MAHSAGKSDEALIQDCLAQLGAIPDEANFGFLYLSDYLSEQTESILNRIKHLTSIPHWTGSVGMAIIASQTEYYDQPAMAIMISSFDENDFRILPNFIDDTSALTGELASWCRSNVFNVGLVHVDPENPLAQTLLHQLATDIPAAFLIGGITSSRSRNLQFADEVLQGGISGVLFSESVSIMSNLTQGCTPIGSRHRVTKFENNVIYSLDDKPALDVLNQDVGEVIARDWQKAAGFIFVGLVNKNSDIDDYSIRQLMGIDKTIKSSPSAII